MTPALRNHRDPIRTKEQAFQDFLAKVQSDWQSKFVEPLVARYARDLAGAYDHLATDCACEVELDKLRAEFSRETRFVNMGLKAPIWGHDKQCECLARMRLIKQRRSEIASKQNVDGLVTVLRLAAG